MELAFVVAVAENDVIGRDNALPWRLSTDLQRFKAITMGSPIVMGRKTWDSFPRRPLPGRDNIVVTRDRTFSPEGAVVANSPRQALELARDLSATGRAYVIGGREIFAQTLDLADILHVTHVLDSPEGDVRLPPIDWSVWEPVSSEEHPAGPRDSHATRYVVYRRRDGSERD